ncbi:MAG: sigma-70 family RNA polymerase sigma factor [Planctomycetes bacterium]|nr:sigma-70 family RNA polymerase sigma factor [Planctomycetota bacterium]
MAESQPFRELYERALDGDRDAAADVYIEYGDHMRRVISYKLKQLNIRWAVEPDDILHSFFRRVINGDIRRTFNSPLHFVNYCELAVRNKCQQMLRSLMLRHSRSISDCPAELFEDQDATEPSEQFAWDERLEAAYSQLTHLERVVCFFRLGEHSWEEIAKRTSKSPDAVRMLHRRAVARIGQQILGGGGGNFLISAIRASLMNRGMGRVARNPRSREVTCDSSTRGPLATAVKRSRKPHWVGSVNT